MSAPTIPTTEADYGSPSWAYAWECERHRAIAADDERRIARAEQMLARGRAALRQRKHCIAA